MYSNLPVTTDEMVNGVVEIFKDVKVHRKQEQVCGWCHAIGAYTFGEMWFYFIDEHEFHQLVPHSGMPYTKRREAFYNYVAYHCFH